MTPTKSQPHSPSSSSCSSTSTSPERTVDPASPQTSPKPLLWRLYLSHTLSTWNARTFEFGAVIFLAAIFPGTLFYASCYALFRSAAATVFGSWIGSQVDEKNRLHVVRQSIVWQRLSVAVSCVILTFMLRGSGEKGFLTYGLFIASVILACFEKLAFVANTVSVERDWIVVVSDSLGTDRQELNSTMRRIDLLCKLLAPVGIGLIDGYSTKLAIWVVFFQNAISVLVEYYAIAHVYAAVPALGHGKSCPSPSDPCETPAMELQQPTVASPRTPPSFLSNLTSHMLPWKNYLQNPAFLASFSLSLLYLTVLSFASQMTTYLLTLGYTSTHVSMMRLLSVGLELSATLAAPYLMTRIGAVRAGLWFINEQVLSIALALGLYFSFIDKPMAAGGVLVAGVCISRLGLWGFDLSVQYLVQDDAPAATRGSFSAVEMALQNFFELVSFATTMIWYRPEEFRIPVAISAAAIMLSAACFAGFVRIKRGHLLHTDRCLKRCGGKKRYRVLPTIEEEVEVEMDGLGGEGRR